jgi:hypothetical protein
MKRREIIIVQVFATSGMTAKNRHESKMVHDIPLIRDNRMPFSVVSQFAISPYKVTSILTLSPRQARANGLSKGIPFFGIIVVGITARQARGDAQ